MAIPRIAETMRKPVRKDATTKGSSDVEVEVRLAVGKVTRGVNM